MSVLLTINTSGYKLRSSGPREELPLPLAPAHPAKFSFIYLAILGGRKGVKNMDYLHFTENLQKYLLPGDPHASPLPNSHESHLGSPTPSMFWCSWLLWLRARTPHLLSVKCWGMKWEKRGESPECLGFVQEDRGREAGIRYPCYQSELRIWGKRRFCVIDLLMTKHLFPPLGWWVLEMGDPGRWFMKAPYSSIVPPNCTQQAAS